MVEEAPHHGSLRRLLAAAGYRLEDRPAGLRAVRARDRRAVLIVDAGRSPPELQGEFPPDALHKTIVYPEDPGGPARASAAERGIEVLDPGSLGPALGELLLVGPTEAAPEPTAKPSVELEPPASIFPEGVRTVRARVNRDDAEAMAQVEGFRCQLRLVPFYVAPYRVRPPSATGVPGTPSDHLVAVNALTGKVEVWEAGERELDPDPEGSDLKLSPVLTEASCRAAAERELRTHHAVSVDHTEQLGGTIVIERRRLPPAGTDLRLGSGVLLYVPFWYIEGSGGRVVIDAVTGARAMLEERDEADRAVVG